MFAKKCKPEMPPAAGGTTESNVLRTDTNFVLCRQNCRQNRIGVSYHVLLQGSLHLMRANGAHARFEVPLPCPVER